MLGSDHGVELYTVAAWCERFPQHQFPTVPSVREWLSYPEQMFLMVTAGAVFRDDVGELVALRERLAYFPQDVWLYKLAAQWGRIAEERVYVGRAGDVGDELGSRVVATRMVGNIMRLAMLIERRYVPYPNWFGAAFARLNCASELAPILERVLAAGSWQEREAQLRDACRFAADLQMASGVPGATEPVEGSLHDRPYRFIDSLKIGDALRAAISDNTLRNLPQFGAADQMFDSNFVLAVPAYTRAVVSTLIETPLGSGGAF